MIAPLPQTPVPPHDVPGTRSGAPEPGGDGFAETLAAAAEAKSAAEVFNQFGFFASGGAIGDAAEMIPAPKFLPVPLEQVRTEPTPATARPEPVEGQFSAGGPLARGAEPIDRLRANGASVPARSAAILSDPMTIAPRPAVARDAAVEAPESVTPSSRRLPIREPAARVTLQVVLREIEQGIHVAARLDALGAGEREAMHDEILALLSRHGLASRGVRIAAPPIPPSHERTN